MFTNILDSKQVALLDLIKYFSKDYYLVGGTAIALQIRHRRSIDFKLFSYKPIKRQNIKNYLQKNELKYITLFEDSEQLHIILKEVKITFFHYPFNVEPSIKYNDIIKMPGLLTLAAIKAYALGGKNKWKDYVDLYFLINKYHSFDEISIKAKEIFGDAFNPKLFKQQLAYFDDINYSESVEYVVPPVDEKTIKDFLTEIALAPF
ncbi:MAG: hypothetical protein COZ21_04930 [Bacteroidetes bacterium CG_4_10_14_3_um_filter_31_20]|nr:hypothetical protein [Bacteroidota bacterium]PIX36332.1 MAG: hypothetical protein COZ59_01670 [Bacteroidetes bacterium CG_4_8_14_3_um_filter_31_14]PIY05056.1 MAG: hypothetical protein COZ21_04930 [Bacteroidetes bacterium CG_4_10_14_3_um_filter_31_20]